MYECVVSLVCRCDHCVRLADLLFNEMTACRYCIFIKCHDKTSCVLKHCCQYLYIQGVCPDLKDCSLGELLIHISYTPSGHRTHQTPHWECPCSGGDTGHGTHHTVPSHHLSPLAYDMSSAALQSWAFLLHSFSHPTQENGKPDNFQGRCDLILL